MPPALIGFVVAVTGFLVLLTPSCVRAEPSEQCDLPPGTKYVYVPPEVTIYSDRSRLNIYLSTTREGLFAFRSLNPSGESFMLELVTDGMPTWIVVPRSDLWRYRFGTDTTLSQSGADHRLKYIMLRSNTAQGTPQCAIEARRANARLLFEKGYAKLLAEAPNEAESLFLEGLKLNSENAEAIFYWGHARVLTNAEFAIGSYEAFREALKMGLPDDLAMMANAHVRHLERRTPCYKEWYETSPNVHVRSCL